MGMSAWFGSDMFSRRGWSSCVFGLSLLPALAAGLWAYQTASASTPSAAPATPAAAKPNVRPARPAGAWKKPMARPAVAHQARATVRKAKQALPKNHVQHQFAFPDGSSVAFRDRPKRSREPARRQRVVVFTGEASAALEPEETFREAAEATGLSATAVTALQFVSRHEGGFDAVNTWDRARFSWGFIQFAGGRGLPLVLAYWKEQEPELFERMLGQYGIDVQPDEEGRPESVCIDPLTGAELRGARAEQAFGDQPLLTAVFIRAGRDPEVKRLQVEAAIEWYARPALEATVGGVPLGSVFTSPKGIAALIDRKVQEGNVGRMVRAVAKVQAEFGSSLSPSQIEYLALQHAVGDATRRAHRDAARRLEDICSATELAGPF